MAFSTQLLILGTLLLLFSGRAWAFGAGNIPSIAQVEGHNWRHGDIEDILTTIAFLKGKKWTSMLIKRVYFGNWLRDYSQAVDVGSLKGVNAPTIRVLVWVLSFMAFGYATEEFEVTEERLGCYRPEEHIDNPLGYADGLDARQFDPRLRGPVDPVETQIDLRTGMKNYIANEQGSWATSAGYLRYSFARSIHYGRLYLHGPRGSSGKEADLCEALRCLGQALHCLEDFSAHSNYCELALRELGYHEVFPHCGVATEINIHGKRVFPLVTGTFGAVDFLHSVIGEATDHFTQSEVDEMNSALQSAQNISTNAISGGSGTRGFSSSSDSGLGDFISLIGRIPGTGDGLASEARDLRSRSAAQEMENTRDNQNTVPGMSPNFDAVKVAGQIYPILQFRDKIVRSISATVSKIPGLEKLLDKIGETLTAFVMGLLAPFIMPIIKSVSKVLKDGSSQVINSSAKSQLEPWTNPHCSDPTHSMLSKDHFTNILNSCAGRVAATVVQYTVPRILHAWENQGVPVDEVVNDVIRAFHHPALRDERLEIHRNMFSTVQKWVDESPKKRELGRILGSDSVRNGDNHILGKHSSHKGHTERGHSHSPMDMLGEAGHGKVAGSLWSQVRTRDVNSLAGRDSDPIPNYNQGAPSHYQYNASQPPPPPSDYPYGGQQYQQPQYQQQPAYGYDAPPPSHGAPQYQGYTGQGQWDNHGVPPPPPGPPGGYPGQQQYGAPPPNYPPPQQYPPQQYPHYQHQQQYQQPPPPPPPEWSQYPGGGHQHYR